MHYGFSVYRYNPEVDLTPSMKGYEIDLPEEKELMVLDALCLLKEQDPSLAFRRSSRDGTCGSDGMNINGVNRLAGMTSVSEFSGNSVVLRPLPGLPVIRDLVVDMRLFYDTNAKVKPYLMADADFLPVKEYLQSPQERMKMDGLYECNLCGCCSSSCPSFWGNPDNFIGPAGLLSAYRWLMDSRDTATDERLSNLDDAYSVFRCRSMMNCVRSCPRGLDPAKAIRRIKSLLVKKSL